MSALANAFALSRPTLYAARAALQTYGLAGLLPNKRGPKQAHKLTDDVLLRLRQLLEADPARSTPELLDVGRDELGVTIHLRTLEKALRRGLHLKKLILPEFGGRDDTLPSTWKHASFLASFRGSESR